MADETPEERKKRIAQQIKDQANYQASVAANAMSAKYAAVSGAGDPSMPADVRKRDKASIGSYDSQAGHAQATAYSLSEIAQRLYNKKRK